MHKREGKHLGDHNGVIRMTHIAVRAAVDDRPAGIPAGVPSMKTAPFNSTQSKADFGKTIFVTGPGGLIVTATAKPLDRSGTGSNFVKTNIKPK